MSRPYFLGIILYQSSILGVLFNFPLVPDCQRASRTLSNTSLPSTHNVSSQMYRFRLTNFKKSNAPKEDRHSYRVDNFLADPTAVPTSVPSVRCHKKIYNVVVIRDFEQAWRPSKIRRMHTCSPSKGALKHHMEWS